MAVAKKTASKATQKEQLLHLVLGGELTGLDGVEFKDLAKVDRKRPANPS